MKTRRTPLRKCTREEAELRTEACMSLLAKGLRKGETKRAMAKMFGISNKQAERYIFRAREAMLERLGRSREEMRAGSLAYYESLLANPKATISEQIHARKRIDKLLGLDEPQRLEHSGPSGGPIQHEQKMVRQNMRTIMTDPDAMALAAKLADKAEEPGR